MQKRSGTSKITRRRFSWLGMSTLASGALSSSCQQEGSSREEKPNILFIIIDDLGQQCGSYGDEIARTPNIDGLASQGVLFENAYVTTSICSPSRASMFTGLYPHQHGCLGMGQWGYRVLRGAPLLPNLLKEQGYRTGLIGKDHMPSQVPWQWDYQERPGPPGRLGTRHASGFAEKTRDFFQQLEDQPFFLSVNFVDPHTPHFSERIGGLPEELYNPEDVRPLPFMGDWDTPALREWIAGYYNNVSRVDTGVGLVMDELEKSGLGENTLVILVGDHGPGFHRAKLSTYETGLRIPFIVRWPGHSPPGLRRKELVSTIDMLPTALSAAGARVPQGLPGMSMVDLVEGKDVSWRDTIMCEYHSNQCADFYPIRTIRDKRYKLVLNLLHERPNPDRGYMAKYSWWLVPSYDDPNLKGTATARAYQTYENPPAVELYDLENDPHEFNNVADQQDYEGVKDSLLERLQTWREQTRDPYLDESYFRQMIEYHDNGVKEQEKTGEVYHARMELLYPDGGDFSHIK